MIATVKTLKKAVVAARLLHVQIAALVPEGGPLENALLRAEHAMTTVENALADALKREIAGARASSGVARDGEET